MISSAPKANMIEFNGSAVDVTTDEFMLRVFLADGREIAAPLEYFPQLRDATPEQRTRFESIGGGYGIALDDLDEHISVPGLLRRH